jgi:hypothetical protein
MTGGILDGATGAALTARAIVAAAISFGDDPAELLAPGAPADRRAITAGAGGLQLATGVSPFEAERLLTLAPDTLRLLRRRAEPSWLKAQESAREAVAWTMKAHGLTRVEPPPPQPDPPPSAPRARAPDKRQTRPPAVAIVDRGVAPPKPAKVVRQMDHVSRAGDLPPVPVEAMRFAVRPRERHGYARVVRPAPDLARVENAVRIRSLSPRGLGFARRFLKADWPVEDIADLFDVPADTLAQALGVAA